jgi:hypothetical protein
VSATAESHAATAATNTRAAPQKIASTIRRRVRFSGRRYPSERRAPAAQSPPASHQSDPTDIPDPIPSSKDQLTASRRRAGRSVRSKGLHSSSPGGDNVAIASTGSLLLAEAYRPQHPCACAQEREVAEHLDDEHDRAISDFAVMSPNPTVAKTVTLKYSASVRVSG